MGPIVLSRYIEFANAEPKWTIYIRLAHALVISLDESTVIYAINLLSGETWLQVVVGYPENRNFNAPFAPHCIRRWPPPSVVYRLPLFVS